MYSDDQLISLGLSYRDIKGYRHEMEVQQLLNEHFINHKGNSKDPYSWKREQGKGVDDIVFSSYTIGIEDKWSEAIIFYSWVQRDWIDRFS